MRLGSVTGGWPSVYAVRATSTGPSSTSTTRTSAPSASAFIAARGVPVLPSHHGRLRLFARFLDPPRAYAAAYTRLGYLTMQVRNQSLYYDEVRNLLPSDRYGRAYVDRLLPDVHRFAREVWYEIR